MCLGFFLHCSYIHLFMLIHITKSIRVFFRRLFHAFFPPCCICCGAPLLPYEKYYCCSCDAGMSRYNERESSADSKRNMTFFLAAHVEHFVFAYYYVRGDAIQKIIHEMKYHYSPDLCRYMGRIMATEESIERVLPEIDYLIPIPIFADRLRERGYNQSELLCYGISDETGIPVLPDAVRRVRRTPKQALRGRDERIENVKDAFEVVAPASLIDKHVAIVDDVVTTGVTTSECIRAIYKIPGIRCSVLSLSSTPHL